MTKVSDGEPVACVLRVTVVTTENSERFAIAGTGAEEGFSVKVKSSLERIKEQALSRKKVRWEIDGHMLGIANGKLERSENWRKWDTKERAGDRCHRRAFTPLGFGYFYE